ncbi:MAG: hypothetical protein A2X81_12770 [Desulfobacterales bacterium GWB2_56_26]|nr:MAG: hypothetical protein A2X81_12770 [Desulfobacterales bacterium GWB2_56_26]
MVCRSLFIRTLEILFFSLCSLIFGIFALTALNEAEDRRRPRVVLLTVESLRDDLVDEESTPHLLRAARTGHRFAGHRAVSGWTATNIVSLLTGLTPFASGVHTRGQSVAQGISPPLAQLAEAGYVVEGLQPFMAMDIYENLGFTINSRGPDPALWLAERRREGQPFFLWYHYVNTHLPYGPEPLPADWPEDAKERLEKVRSQASILHDEVTFSREDVARIHALQRNRIREFDRWFADFWAFWQGSGCGRDTILIVTADHGDEHGERGMTGHASTTLAGHLHEEIVRVPLFIWLPEQFAHLGSTARTGEISSHLDIMPTILARLGIAPQIRLEGRDLFAAPKEPHRQTGSRPWLGMTASGGFAEPDPGRMRYFEYACLQGNWKSRLRVLAGGTELFALYDVTRDPGETIDLAASRPDIAAAHRKLLRSAIESRVQNPIKSGPHDRNAEEGDGMLGWLRPSRSGSYSYEELAGSFILQWSGAPDRDYLLDYRAGNGRKALTGTMAVRGAMKDFGTIDRRYWQTWIVPNSPFRLRVREADGPGRSPWLELEARP